MTMIIDGTLGETFPDGSLQTAAASPYVLRNRIINGAMVIDQRNAGASVSSGYPVDRFTVDVSQSSKLTAQQNANSVTSPVGFTNYLGVTSSSAYSVASSDYFLIAQRVEGYNWADLNWGSSNAKTITLSFWVRSSLTGTFGGSLRNNDDSRSYVFSYTISAANTWEQKTITIAGDTTGTWNTTTGRGVNLSIGIGTGSSLCTTAGSWVSGSYLNVTGATSVVGTNGATFYITGVQLEIGSTATPFERRLYNQELANCQRYLPTANNGDYYTGQVVTTTNSYASIRFPVTARVAPTGISISSLTGYTTTNVSGSGLTVTNTLFAGAGVNAGLVRFDVATGLSGAYATLTFIGTAPLLFTGCEL
jgi:hypothetical protein